MEIIIRWVSKEEYVKREKARFNAFLEEAQWESDRIWRRNTQKKIRITSSLELERLEKMFLNQQKKCPKLHMAFGNRTHVNNGGWRIPECTAYTTGSIAKN